ncbi:MAG: UTP--glucose-1-phosphate uridylyltransferase GalU [Acidimicrobiales bacterium]
MTNQVRKAVIPAAGLGTRFLPATKAQPKEMLPLVDKPAIQYVVEEAAGAGLNDVLIVTGRGKRSLEDHFDRSFELEHFLEQGNKLDELAQVKAISKLAAIHYVRQADPKGLGDAVSIARRHVGEESFVVMLADDIMDRSVGLLEAMLAAHGDSGATIVALKEVPEDEVSSYGCAHLADESVSTGGSGGLVLLDGLVEKPSISQAPSRLAVMGRYVFTPRIFDVLGHVRPGKGGEIQLTDAISSLMAQEPVYGYVFDRGRYDVGNKLDYLRANVELALARDDLGPAFRRMLSAILDEGSTT